MSVRPNRPGNWRTAREPLPALTAAMTQKSSIFIEACMGQGVKPTRRQAAKYNAGRGRWAR